MTCLQRVGAGLAHATPQLIAQGNQKGLVRIQVGVGVEEFILSSPTRASTLSPCPAGIRLASAGG